MKALLLSSAFAGEGEYFEHCKAAIADFLAACPPGHVLFAAYANSNEQRDAYGDIAKIFFNELGHTCISLHRTHDPDEAIRNHDIKAIYVGGGNTFRLLKNLQDLALLEPIREAVRAGAGYMGASAGSNMACPTIMTTNDMPIMQPDGFAGLGLVDFQVNAHFVARPLIPGHHGETREQRIKQYHEENDTPVVGLPETTWLRVEDQVVNLGGTSEAIYFRRGEQPTAWVAGEPMP